MVHTTTSETQLLLSKPPDPVDAPTVKTYTSAASKPKLAPRFSPVDLSARQYSTVDGKPSVFFSTTEFEAGATLFKHSLITKFTVGRPTIGEIRQVFKDNWSINGRATVSDIWDSRHLMIILDFEEDAKIALTSPLRKVGHAMFRLLRYTPDYNPKKESTIITKWAGGFFGKKLKSKDVFPIALAAKYMGIFSVNAERRSHLLLLVKAFRLM
ncbi:hypothetical protein QQ045_019076 [Rhodiola kirilowii]